MYWLLGLGLVGLLGYLAVKRTEAAAKQLGQTLVQNLGAGSGMTTVTLSASTPQGDQGQFGLLPGDTFVINAYPPPTGYVWKFDGGGVMPLSPASTATSASFASPATPPSTPFTIYANLVKAHATLPPMATYKFEAQYALPGTTPTPPLPASDAGGPPPPPMGGPRVSFPPMQPASKTVTIGVSASMLKGVAAQPALMGPQDTLAVRAYAAPAGYKWLVSSDVLTSMPLPTPTAGQMAPTYAPAPGQPQLAPIALFSVPAGVTSATVQVILVRQQPPPVDPVLGAAGAAAVVAPIAIYKFPVNVTGV